MQRSEHQANPEAYVKLVVAGTIGLEEEPLPGGGSTGMVESTTD